MAFPNASESKRRRYWGFVNALPAPLLAMIAKQAEAQGLVGLFAPQVYGPPFVPLAAAAMVTERILLASGIAMNGRCAATSSIVVVSPPCTTATSHAARWRYSSWT